MTIRPITTLLILIAFAAAVSACSSDPVPTPPTGIVLTTPVPNPTATPEAVVTRVDGEVVEFEVHLSANGSPQQGTAVFTRRDGYTDLVVRLSPGVRAQSATIRSQPCPSTEGFTETLDLVIGGVLRQQIRGISFEEFISGDLTLLINTDTQSFRFVAACADLPELE